MKSYNIKQKVKVFVLIIGTAVLAGCTNLDETIYSSYTDENFPSSPKQYASMTGPIYVAAQKLFDNNLYELQEMGTDEIIVPTRGGDWYDGGRYVDMHYHNWTPSHVLVTNAWNTGFNAIGTCNQVLNQFENLEDTDDKEKTVAEIKIMEEATALNYGRPTQGMAYTLAAKLYLNAEVYVGQPMWKKAEEYCNKVIELNQYTLGDYFEMFKPDNGADEKEIIFAVPFDSNKATGNRWQLRTLHFSHRNTFSLTATPYNGWCVAPGFFDSYQEEDIRKKVFLWGQQYDANGNPMEYSGVNVWLDPYGFDAFDVGGADDKGRLVGARCIKYYPDKDGTGGWANNDFVVFRYGDVLMMKAEALIRQGKDLSTAIDLVNQIRGRAFPNNQEQLFKESSFNLDSLYDERGREFVWEMHRRTDMIRFGKFEDPLLFKPSTSGEEYRRIFPIPTSAIMSNPNLDQNPEY